MDGESHFYIVLRFLAISKFFHLCDIINYGGHFDFKMDIMFDHVTYENKIPQSCQHAFFENHNPMSKILYFGSKICNAL